MISNSHAAMLNIINNSEGYAVGIVHEAPI